MNKDDFIIVLYKYKFSEQEDWQRDFYYGKIVKIAANHVHYEVYAWYSDNKLHIKKSGDVKLATMDNIIGVNEKFNLKVISCF